MAFDRNEFTKLLEDSYSAYYNIVKENLPTDLPIVFRAEFFQRTEKYWFTKSVPIFGNEMNEYAYVFSADYFDEELVKKCTQYALDDGLPRVVPHKEHQYTNIKVLFISLDYSDDAISEITRRSFQKTYRFSFWGYSNLLSAAVDVDNEKIYTNRAAYEMKAYFKKLFAAQKT